MYRDILYEARENGINHFSVGAGVFKEGKLLVLKRKENDTFGGMFEIPGGGVEDNESLEDAVRRELLEETGLVMDNILYYSGNFDYGEGEKYTREFNFIVSVSSFTDIILTEHDEYRFITAEEIPLCTDEMHETIVKLFSHFESK